MAFHTIAVTLQTELVSQNHWNVNRKIQNQLLANNQLMTSAQRLVIRRRNFLEDSLLRAKSAEVNKFSTRKQSQDLLPVI